MLKLQRLVLTWLSSIANTLQGFEFVFQCRSVALLWYLSPVFFLYCIWSQHIVLTFSFRDVLVDKCNADRLNKEFKDDKEYKWSVRGLISMTRIKLGMSILLFLRMLCDFFLFLHLTKSARKAVQTRERHRIPWH